MSKQVQIEIVSPEHNILFSGQASYLVASGILGELAVYPGHAPLLTALKPGSIRIVHEKNREDIFYATGGILEVQPNVVTILADTVIRAAHLDEAAAKQAQASAEQTLSARQADKDYATIAAELAQAVAQLQVIQRWRKQLKT